MADADFFIGEGDQFPWIDGKLREADGSVANLTGLEDAVKFRMRKAGSTVDKVYAAAEVVGDPINGDVVYKWLSPDDTDTPGLYRGRWEVTRSGKKQQYPNASSAYDGYIVVQVTRKG